MGKAKKKASVTPRPDIDCFSTGEFSLREIGRMTLPVRGNKFGISRQAVHEYLSKSGRLKKFLERRERYMTSERLENARAREEDGIKLRTFLDFLARFSYSKGWAVGKTIERYSEKPPSYPIEKFARFLQAYEIGHASGNPATLEEMRKILGARHVANVSSMLKYMGLKPFRSVPQSRTPNHKKAAIGRAYKTDYPLIDIAYFTGVPGHIPAQIMRIRFGSTGKRSKCMTRFDREAVFYRDASAAYEAQDAGMPVNEVIEYVGKSPEAVDYLLEHRTQIEPKIISYLMMLYPDVTHDKPYITEALRRS